MENDMEIRSGDLKMEKKNSGQSLQQHVKYGLLTSGSFTKIGSKQIGIMPMPIKYIYWLI
jgi:hypothetical protein